MKVAIISDIHANLTALNAVLEDCKNRYGNIKYINLGDCIDYGMRPNETIDKLLSLKNDVLVNLKGNHERAILGFEADRFSSKRGLDANNYTKTILNKSSNDYINSMKDEPCELDLCDKRILCVHGDLSDIHWGKMADEEIKDEIYSKYDYVFSGHTHISSYRSVINSDKTHKTIFINSGSVGQPRNLNPQAQYCVVDLINTSVDFRSVSYDIESELNLYNGEIDKYYRDRLISGI